MKRTVIKCEKCNDEISKSNYSKHLKSCNRNGKYKPLINCPHCNLKLSTFINYNEIGNHIRWCGDKSINNINWCEIQEVHNSGIYWTVLPKMFKISFTRLKRALKLGLIKKIKHEIRYSEETKKELSEKRKKYLFENKDKHVWKRNDKFKSVPCEHFKNILKENSIDFVSEYSPINSNNFSVDIVFPDKKIGIEINGNQHYNSDKTLKKYYQERHDLIEANGWKLFELHYSLVYKEDFISKFVNELKHNFELGKIDYSFYFNKNKKIKICVCGDEIKSRNGIVCDTCSRMNRRKIENRPTLGQLLFDVNTSSYKATSRKYGVSDVCIRKWIKSYGGIPPKKHKI